MTADLGALAGRWRLLREAAQDGATNMATDAALLAHARRTGEGVLRIYAWQRPTLSLGRHERARGLFDPARLDAAGVDVVRRPTGGRALLHHREVTYAVAAPALLPLGDSYAAINALLLGALGRLSVRAALAAPAARPLRPDGAACFAEPAAGELVVGGAKLVGSAQLREDGALLQHGSILLDDDQPLIARLRAPGAGSEAARPVAPAGTLRTALGREVAFAEVADALEAELDAGRTASPLDAGLLADDLARLVIAFRDPAWTWRR